MIGTRNFGVRTSRLVGSRHWMTKPCTLVLVLMDDPTVDDEKPFDVLGAQNDDDSQPDPDEHLMLESGHGRVWLVKVCNHHCFDVLRLICPTIPPPDPKISDGALVKVRYRGSTTGQDPYIQATERHTTNHRLRATRGRGRRGGRHLRIGHESVRTLRIKSWSLSVRRPH